MKLLRTIGLLLLVLLIIVAVLAFIAPTQLNVERSAVINAPANRIFPLVKSLKEREAWSDWNRTLDDMTSEIIGQDGTVGAKTVWKSVKGGNGEQEIIAITPNKQVDTKLRFEGRDDADASVILEPVDGGTKVTWTLTSESSRPFNIPFLFSDFGIGESYVKSLGYLKEMTEGGKRGSASSLKEKIEEQPQYNIQEVEFSGKTFAALRKKMRMAEAYGFIKNELPIIQLQFDKRELANAGNPCRLVYNWDEDKGNAELAVAIPTDGAVNFGGDYSSIKLPSRKAVMLEYYGDHTTIKAAHKLIQFYMNDKGLKQVPPIVEEYVTDPEQELDPAKWLTKVYFFTK